MTFGSRKKGAVAEREIAKLFQAWWQSYEPGEFVRAPLSGGWSQPPVRAGFKVCGDICTTAKHFPFCIEAKRREGWSFDNFHKQSTFRAAEQIGRSPVWGWWKQAVKAAEEQKVEPLLVFRKSRMPWWGMLKASWFEASKYRRIRSCLPTGDTNIFPLEKLFELDPKLLLKEDS